MASHVAGDPARRGARHAARRSGADGTEKCEGGDRKDDAAHDGTPWMFEPTTPRAAEAFTRPPEKMSGRSAHPGRAATRSPMPPTVPPRRARSTAVAAPGARCFACGESRPHGMPVRAARFPAGEHRADLALRDAGPPTLKRRFDATPVRVAPYPGQVSTQLPTSGESAFVAALAGSGCEIRRWFEPHEGPRRRAGRGPGHSDKSCHIDREDLHRTRASGPRGGMARRVPASSSAQTPTHVSCRSAFSRLGSQDFGSHRCPRRRHGFGRTEHHDRPARQRPRPRGHPRSSRARGHPHGVVPQRVGR